MNKESFTHGEFDLVRNRFLVAMGLYGDKSRLTSKCGKNKKVIYEMPDVFCDPLLYEPQATWIYFAFYNRQGKSC